MTHYKPIIGLIGATLLLIAWLGSLLTLSGVAQAQTNRQADTCQARVFNAFSDGPVFTTVQEAVNNSFADTDIVKVAGYCASAAQEGNINQTLYLDNKALTIRGGYTTTNWTVSNPEANPTTLDAQELGRVVYIVGDNSHVRLENLRLTGGHSGGGGGIYHSAGVLKLNNILVLSNTSTSWGGGIASKGILHISNSVIAHNTALNSWDGGGIYSSETALITNSTIISNSADGYGGGISNRGALTLTNSLVMNNLAKSGGGLYVFGDSSQLVNTVVSSNTATSDNGGGINNASGSLTLLRSKISHNQASSGGGGIYNSINSLTLLDSTISNNIAGFGGGIRNLSGDLEIINSTISGNQANNGGGIYNQAISGVIVVLTNATISGNTAQAGGGINHFLDGSRPILKNSIVAINGGGGNCSGGVVSHGHNLSSDATCAFTATTDINNTNPLLGPLRDNGGETPTHALLPGSPALDAADNSACPATDQRGVARPQGDACDIGAVEMIFTNYLPLIVKPALPPPQTELSIRTINTGQVTIQVRDPNDGEALLLTCIVGSDVTQLCGTFEPVGTYRLVAITDRCGMLTGVFNDAAPGATITREVFCN